MVTLCDVVEAEVNVCEGDETVDGLRGGDDDHINWLN